MTVVQIQANEDNSRRANIWVLPDNVADFNGLAPTITLANIFSPPTGFFDRVVLLTSNNASADQVRFATELYDVVSVPNSGSLALVGIAGVVALTSSRRR
jgi:hypothetical protein